MTLQVGTLRYDIQVDLRNLNQAMGQARQQASGLSNSFRTAGAAMAGAFAGGMIINQLRDMINAASELEQTLGLTEQTFGDGAPGMRAWAEGLADLGLSTNQALTSVSLFTGALKNQGYEAAAAAQEAQKLTLLATDMSAGFGGTVQDALEALRGVLKGERDSIEKYNVGITEADVKTRAYAMGLAKEGDELSKAAKAQASLAIVYEQTALIQGQATREMDTTAGAVKSFEGNLENLKATLGEELLPLVTDLAKQGTEWAKWAGENKDLIITLSKVAIALGAVAVAWKGVSAAVSAATAAQAAFTGAAGAANLAALGGAAKAMPLVGIGAAAGATGYDMLANDTQARFVNAMAGPDAGLLEQYLTGVGGAMESFTKNITFGLVNPMADVEQMIAAQDQLAGVDAQIAAAKEKMAAASGKAKDAAKDETDALEDQKRKLEENKKATEAWKTAKERATSAEQAYKDAVKSTTDSLMSGGLFAEDPGAGARASAASASRDARRNLADARRELATTRQSYVESSSHVAEAKRAVADAQRAVADAARAQNEAAGLSQSELLSRASMNARKMAANNAAIRSLVGAGLNPEIAGQMLDLEKQYPGTLQRIVNQGISKPFVQALNSDFREQGQAAKGIAKALNVGLAESAKELRAKAYQVGKSVGDAYRKGVSEGGPANLPEVNAPRTRPGAAAAPTQYGQYGIPVQPDDDLTWAEWRRRQAAQARRDRVEGR